MWYFQEAQIGGCFALASGKEFELILITAGFMRFTERDKGRTHRYIRQCNASRKENKPTSRVSERDIMLTMLHKQG